MRMASPILDHLLTRNSAPIPELKEPAPSDQEIRTMLTAATRVPDHGRLAPWRFILYRGDVRKKIGEKLLELAEKREGPLPDNRRNQELTRFSRAPLVIGVISSPKENPKIPQWEISNWYSDTEEGRALLGLAPHERMIGFVHIGTYEGTAPERPRPDVSTLYADYSGPWAS
jgi:nitroreductase